MPTISTVILLLALSVSCLQAQQGWQPVPMPGAKQISSFCTAADGSLFSASSDGIFRLSGDALWEKVPSDAFGSVNAFCSFRAKEQTVLLAATTQGGVLRSTDNGSTWAQSNKGLGTLHVNTIFQTSSGSLLAGTSYGGVYQSDDGGMSWVQTGMEGEHVTGFTQTSDGRILLSTYRGIFVSDNGRTPWKESLSGLTNRVVECLVSAQDGSILAGCYNVGPCAPGGMFRSEDKGATWTKIGFENQHIKALLSTPQGLLAGTWCGGVSRSVDNGKEWVAINDGLNEQCIQGLGITTDGTVYAGCYGAQNTVSMYKISLAQPIIAGEDLSNPSLLEEISPNPVNSTATIRFTVTRKSFVSLQIMSNIGEVIATLISEVKMPGSYTVEWDAAKIENGMYVARLQEGKRVESAPIIVVK